MFSINKIGRGDKGTEIAIGNITVYFSYNTIVAFETPEHGLICCENIWGSTTGNHLNSIEPDHDARYDPGTFKGKLEELEFKLSKAGI
jgi:hypothetical protein